MRTLKVTRLQFMNKDTFIWAPLIILACCIVISFAIFAIIPGDMDKYGGAAQGVLWYFAAVAIYALTRTFPFSQALSVTRRQFYVGTLLAAVLTAAALAVLFVIGGYAERATGGFWVRGYMFSLPWIWESGPVGAAFVYFTIAMLFFVIGYLFAVIYKSLGNKIMLVCIAALSLALIGLIGLATWQNAWPAVWAQVTQLGAVGLAAWGLLIAAVLAVIGWFPMRRAIP